MSDSKEILLVDDEHRFCDSLSQILVSSGFSVTVAHSGEMAIKTLSEKIFDLLLLDVELPDMLGYQIIDHLRGRNIGVAVIMLTGNSNVKTAIEALKNGVYDYLTKPVDYDLLFKTIDKAIKHSELEKSLRINEERFRILTEASWEGIVIHEVGRLLDANKQFFEMFGYQKEELLDQHVLDKIFSTISVLEAEVRIESDIFGTYEFVGRRKDGTEFPIETSSRPIQYRGRQVRVCAIRDISERVKIEQEKQDLQAKLAVASKMETLGLMAGSVAHDLNNILSGIVTLPELLLRQLDDDSSYRETITVIQEAGKEAASVVSDLITIARGATAKKLVCNPNTLVQNYIRACKKQRIDSRLEEVDIQTRYGDGIKNIRCSTVHLNKVLMNLIGNAAEAISGKGIISISTKNVSVDEPLERYEQIKEGDYVVISVKDDGGGISSQDVGKIFDPFYSKKVVGRSGTGLGLSIVWNTVHDHNGFLNVKNDDNGTTFDLYFPATEEEVTKDGKITSVEEYRGQGETVLVVDDQKKQQLIACNLLKNIGYTALSVSSGEEAVNYVRDHVVDLVILDMIMPAGISGRETYEKILEIRPGQRALIASGFAENDEVERTLSLGANQFVKKPYTFTRMGMAVKRALT